MGLKGLMFSDKCPENCLGYPRDCLSKPGRFSCSTNKDVRPLEGALTKKRAPFIQEYWILFVPIF